MQRKERPIFPDFPEAAQPFPLGFCKALSGRWFSNSLFLLSIPAILGDLGVEAYLQLGSFSEGVGISPLNLEIGLVFMVVAGYLAIVWVKKLVLSKRFLYFAAYAFVLGEILITLALSGLQGRDDYVRRI